MMNAGDRRNGGGGQAGVMMCVNPTERHLRCLRCKHCRMISWPPLSWIVVWTIHRMWCSVVVCLWAKLRSGSCRNRTESVCCGVEGKLKIHCMLDCPFTRYLDDKIDLFFQLICLQTCNGCEKKDELTSLGVRTEVVKVDFVACFNWIVFRYTFLLFFCSSLSCFWCIWKSFTLAEGHILILHS